MTLIPNNYQKGLNDAYECSRDELEHLRYAELSNAILVEKLEERNKELVEMLEIVKSNLTFYDQKLYNQITELLNKVK